MMNPIKIELGIDAFIKHHVKKYESSKVGLVCHQASVNRELNYTHDLLAQVPDLDLQVLFSPQHGLFATKQANMVETNHTNHPTLNIPVYSLYSSQRTPPPHTLEPLDVLIIDLQDVGTRVFTYIHTLSLCLQACKDNNTSVIVLDRPNPIGGIKVEGNLLDPAWRSFVGLHPIVMRHGLTIGEMAIYLNEQVPIGARLDVIPMRKYTRTGFFSETGLPWINPSPNMPSETTALVYPGMVLFEGCTCSEGRGTTRPFELFGAPYLIPEQILPHVHKPWLVGCVLRHCAFEPTFDKYQGETCWGFQIHVTDPERFQPFRLALTLLKTIRRIYPTQFSYLPPPYEYEWLHLPIDILTGNPYVRKYIEGDVSEAEMEGWLRDHERVYQLETSDFYLY
jgi:uncharacterized protein YbbC (DUF1343 family)